MIKSLFEAVLFVLFPLLLIFTVYRFCLGYNPLNFKAIIQIISEQFNSTGNYFTEFVRLQSQVFNEVELLTSERLSVVRVGFSPFDSIIEFLVEGIVSIGVNVYHISDYIRIYSNLLMSFIGDFIGATLALTEFLVDSSPYLVQPYFPVGS